MRSAPFLDWTDIELGAMLETATGLPVVIDNDLTAFTEYERWFGAGRNADRFAVITLGAGVGYGLVAGGEVVADDDAGIGLVGHWPLDPFGPGLRVRAPRLRAERAHPLGGRAGRLRGARPGDRATTRRSISRWPVSRPRAGWWMTPVADSGD